MASRFEEGSSSASPQANSTAGVSRTSEGVDARPERRAFSRKCVGEEGIHEVEDRRYAPEILGQCQPTAFGKPIAIVLEQLGPGPPEPIDRLLVVADQEEFPLEQTGPGEGFEDLRLDRVGVLELVDEDEVDRAGERLADGPRRVGQQVPGEEEEVVIVDAPSRPLGSVESLLGPERQPGEHQPLPGGREGRRLVPVQGRLEFLGVLADRIEMRLDGLVGLGRGPILGGKSLDLRDLFDPGQGGVLVAFRLQLVQAFREFGEPGPDSFVVERVAGDELEARPRLLPERLDQGGLDLSGPHLDPGVDELARLARGPILEIARGAIGQQVFEGLADHPQAEVDGQLDQVGVASGQPFSQRVGERFLADREGDGLVEHGEAGVDPRLDREAAEHVPAERVEGPDPRPSEASEDGPPAERVAAGVEPGPAFLADSLAKLPGRLVGERQGDDPPERAGVRPLEGPDEALGQDERLAAARPGAQRDARTRDREGLDLLEGRGGPTGARGAHDSSPSLGLPAQDLPTIRTSPTRQAEW